MSASWSGIKKKSKYNAKRVKTTDGVFHSKREYGRWLDLLLLERVGKITGLKRQQPYEINVNGKKVCKYIADFTYTENGEFVVEDSKGCRTDLYKLKAKLMLAVHDITIKET